MSSSALRSARRPMRMLRSSSAMMIEILSMWPESRLWVIGNRQFRRHARAAVCPGYDCATAANLLGAFAHRRQPHSRPAIRRQADAIITNIYTKRQGSINAQTHRARSRPRVFDHVGEGFLRDAINGDFDGGGQ